MVDRLYLKSTIGFWRGTERSFLKIKKTTVGLEHHPDGVGVTGERNRSIHLLGVNVRSKCPVALFAL